MGGPYSSMYKCLCKKWQQLRMVNLTFFDQDEKHSTKKNGMELFKGHFNEEEFFLHGMVILLQLSQFMRPMHNRLFLLDNYSAHLIVRSIDVNVEWFIVVEVCHNA